MTTAAQIRDRIAARIAAIDATWHVYANGSSGESGAVLPWPPETLDDGPHALVGRGPTVRTGGTGNQMVSRGVDVTWLLSVDPARAEQLADDIEDQLLEAFSDGITLDGAVIECVYAGSDAVVHAEPDAEGREWVSWVTHFAARQRYSREMTP